MSSGNSENRKRLARLRTEAQRKQEKKLHSTSQDSLDALPPSTAPQRTNRQQPKAHLATRRSTSKPPFENGSVGVQGAVGLPQTKPHPKTAPALGSPSRMSRLVDSAEPNLDALPAFTSPSSTNLEAVQTRSGLGQIWSFVRPLNQKAFLRLFILLVILGIGLWFVFASPLNTSVSLGSVVELKSFQTELPIQSIYRRKNTISLVLQSEWKTKWTQEQAIEKVLEMRPMLLKKQVGTVRVLLPNSVLLFQLHLNGSF